MEEANHGAFDVGAKTVGLNISLPHEQYPNPYVTTDLFFSFHYFALRSLHFPLRAKALVAFPGGYGTFDELFEVLTLIERTIKPIPVVLVGESYWQAVRYRGWTENIALRLASADAKSFQLDRVPTRP
jgi:predicted Rossmann-fold nucleotide-binding protein